MTAEAILQQVRRACAKGDASSPEAAARLARIVGREGAVTILLRLLREGPLAEANLAAVALRHVREPLIRRGLVRDAARATGERRSAWLLALTAEELGVALAKDGRALGLELLFEMGLVAVRDPRGFVELACRDVSAADERVVDLCERVRARYGLSAAAMYGPLLERPLVPEARARVVSLLGQEAGDGARRVLEKEQSRAGGETAKEVRRERLRQATRALETPVPKAIPKGVAVLSPLVGEGDWSLEIMEELGEGHLLVFGGVVRANGTAELYTGTEEATVALADDRVRTAPALTRITLGEARTVLEMTGRRARPKLSPVIDRLVDVPGSGAVAPAQELLDSGAAFALVTETPWAAWRPFAKLVASLSLSPPGGDNIPWADACGDEVVAKALAVRGASSRLAMALRHQAFVMQARGDVRAGAVAAEAVRVARKRPGTILHVIAMLEVLRRITPDEA